MDRFDRGSGSNTSLSENVVVGFPQVMFHLSPSRVSGVFFSIAIFGPLLWMLMDREPPYEFINVEITPKHVEPGGQIDIEFTVKQLRPTCGPGLVYREFKELSSGKLHVIDPVPRAAAPVIVDGKFTRTATLPKTIAPGLTEYRGEACYSCNPVHTWVRWPVCSKTPVSDRARFTVEQP